MSITRERAEQLQRNKNGLPYRTEKKNGRQSVEHKLNVYAYPKIINKTDTK